MNDNRPSRRELLRYCSTGVMAGLAGCLWGNSGTGEGTQTPTNSSKTATPKPTPTPTDSGPKNYDYASAFGLAGDGTAPFRNWVIPNNPRGVISGVTSVCAYRNFEQAAKQNVTSMQNYRRGLGNGFGIDPESFQGELIVGDPNGSGGATLLLGSIDTNAVTDHLDAAKKVTITDLYRGYSVFKHKNGNVGAVGPDGILDVSNYRSYIDAKKGDRKRLTETSKAARDLFSVLPSGLQISISRHKQLSDLTINGSTYQTYDENGNPERVTRAFVFESEDSATTKRAREIISEGKTGYKEILTEQQHGRMVMTEYIADW